MTYEQRLRRVIVDHLGPVSDPTFEKRFRQELRCDAIDMEMIHRALEGEFNVDIAESDFAQVNTVRDAAFLIDRLVACAAIAQVSQ